MGEPCGGDGTWLWSVGDGWGMVNAAGCSEVGFWPLYFGDDYFILIVSGMPRFNQEAFTTLVWALGVRYGRTSI